MYDESTPDTPRRGFLGRMAAAAVGFGAAGLLPAPARAATVASPAADSKLEAWFGKLAGKHRTVFDAPAINEGMPAIWPRVYLLTTDATYPGGHAVAMIILRHTGLAMAFQDSIWAKYPIGEMFNVLNRTQFNGPELNPTNGNFGRITSAANLPRVLQLALRFRW